MTSLPPPRAVLACIVVVIVLAGCRSSIGGAVDGPLIRYPQEHGIQDEMLAEVRGVLELDNGCLYVSVESTGERYPIVWPAGTRWDPENQAVVTPRGESAAIGHEVYGSGGYLHVVNVELIAGSQAAALAAECVDNEYGEIAVLNNADTAIGPAQP